MKVSIEVIRNIGKELSDTQTQKISIVMKILEPGFLPFEEEIKEFSNERIKKKKIELTHGAMHAMIRKIREQQSQVIKFLPRKSVEIKASLANEIAVCTEITRTENIQALIKRLHELKEKIIFTTVLINKTIKNST